MYKIYTKNKYKQHPPSDLESWEPRLYSPEASAPNWLDQIIYATDFAGNKACVKIYNMKRKLLTRILKMCVETFITLMF